MRGRTFVVAIVAAVLLVTLANVSWADGRGRGWYQRPAAPAHHGWYGHPYYYHGYRYYYVPRLVYLPPPGVVYAPAPGAMYAPVPAPAYGGGYLSSGIWLPGLSFSVSFPLH
jgi:hypothetical protein